MYSAIKVHGRPLYELARQGIAIPREGRDVNIFRLEVRDYRPPLMELDVACSKGTYIRVLAEDIGAALGCGGMLQELRRTRSGDFDVADAVTLQELAEMRTDERDRRLITADRLIAHLPRLQLDEPTSLALLQGRVGGPPFGLSPGLHRAYGPAGDFLGLVEHVDGMLRPRRMMACALRRDEQA
jgi:tRNA pseudouridine55 synthase